MQYEHLFLTFWPSSGEFLTSKIWHVLGDQCVPMCADWLLRFFVVFLWQSRQILRQCLHTGNDGFLPHPFQFIIHKSFYHSTHALQQAVLNKARVIISKQSLVRLLTVIYWVLTSASEITRILSFSNIFTGSQSMGTVHYTTTFYDLFTITYLNWSKVKLCLCFLNWAPSHEGVLGNVGIGPCILWLRLHVCLLKPVFMF